MVLMSRSAADNTDYFSPDVTIEPERPPDPEIVKCNTETENSSAATIRMKDAFKEPQKARPTSLPEVEAKV
jgi:hypothetical protein